MPTGDRTHVFRHRCRERILRPSGWPGASVTAKAIKKIVLEQHAWLQRWCITDVLEWRIVASPDQGTDTTGHSGRPYSYLMNLDMPVRQLK